MSKDENEQYNRRVNPGTREALDEVLEWIRNGKTGSIILESTGAPVTTVSQYHRRILGDYKPYLDAVVELFESDGAGGLMLDKKSIEKLTAYEVGELRIFVDSLRGNKDAISHVLEKLNAA